MAKGGKRPGAGRPKGSTNVPRFADLISQKEKEKFREFLLDTYMGDMRLALWMADQIYGKAPQSIDHTTLGERLPTPLLSNVPTDDSTEEDKKA